MSKKSNISPKKSNMPKILHKYTSIKRGTILSSSIQQSYHQALNIHNLIIKHTIIYFKFLHNYFQPDPINPARPIKPASCPRHGFAMSRHGFDVSDESNLLTPVGYSQNVFDTCRARGCVRHVSDTDTPLFWACPYFRGFQFVTFTSGLQFR